MRDSNSAKKYWHFIKLMGRSASHIARPRLDAAHRPRLELARDARSVDMRASPYDFSAVGLAPICIETPEGRSEYEQEQRRLTKKAEPLRARLIASLNGALSVSV